MVDIQLNYRANFLYTDKNASRNSYIHMYTLNLFLSISYLCCSLCHRVMIMVLRAGDKLY